MLKMYKRSWGVAMRLDDENLGRLTRRMYENAYGDNEGAKHLGLLEDYYDVLMKEVNANKKRGRKDINNKALANEPNIIASSPDVIANEPKVVNTKIEHSYSDTIVNTSDTIANDSTLIANGKITSGYYLDVPGIGVGDTPEEWIRHISNEIDKIKILRKNRDKDTQPLSGFDNNISLANHELKYCKSLPREELQSLIVILNKERANGTRTSKSTGYTNG